jgi:hypothetical protein
LSHRTRRKAELECGAKNNGRLNLLNKLEGGEKNRVAVCVKVEKSSSVLNHTT